MSDDLSQLDALIESDILEALGQSVPKEETTHELDSLDDLLGSSEVTDLADIQNDSIEPIQEKSNDLEESIEDIGDIDILPMAEIESALDDQEDEPISMNSNDLGSLADILSKLLNNKTIEITIKIKD